MFIVIEKHGGPEYATICINEAGETLVFDTIEEAQKECDDLQDGIIVPINEPDPIKEAATRLVNELRKVYGDSASWDEVIELEKLLGVG